MKQRKSQAKTALAVSLSGVTKTYRVKTEALSIFESLKLDIREKQTIAIIGPSGCGKSTLLKLVAGLDNSYEGTISIGGQSALNARKAGEIGFAFQEPNLLPWRSVEENIRLPLEICANKDNPASIQEILQMVGLQNYANYFPHQLSGGMAARAGLARALISNPKVLLLDEPFRSLDEITRNKLNQNLLSILKSENSRTTTIIVTHSIIESIFLGDKVILFSKKDGMPAEIAGTWDIPEKGINEMDAVLDDVELTDIRHELLQTMDFN